MFHKRSSNGFSITELLLVIALVTIAAAGSLPTALGYLRDHQTTEAAESVAAQIRTARIQAVQTNAPNGMTLSFGYPGPQDLYLTKRGKPGVRDRLQAASPTPAAIFSLPEGFQFEPLGGPFNSLLFRSDGTVEGTELAEGIEGLIAVDGMNFVVKVRHAASGLTQTLLIGRSGTIAVP